MLRFISVFFLSLFSLLAFPQKTDGNHAFKSGEVMEYDAYFNLGPIWIKLGYAKFTVETVNENDFKYTVTAYNLPKWDWIYSLYTVHSATSTSDLRPLTFDAVTTENGVYSEVKYTYDNEKNIVHRWKKNKKHPDGVELDFKIQPYSQDIINSIYVARNVDLTQNGGKDIPFYPVYDDIVATVYGNVLGKQVIKTRNGKKYSCLRCMAIPPKNTMFDASESVNVWITDDGRAIPVLVEAKIMIGRVKIYLSSYKEE